MSTIKEEYLISGPIRERIDTAQRLYDMCGKSLAEDPVLNSLRERLETKLAATKQLMQDFGVIEACRFCEEEDGGSCCGTGIENKYEPVILLTNLLLGGALPRNHRFADSCYFLGDAGCVLKVRHVLCVNYLCTKIRTMLMPEELKILQNVVGEEIDTAFLLHEQIRKLIRS